jgi:hypothetical protein
VQETGTEKKKKKKEQTLNFLTRTYSNLQANHNNPIPTRHVVNPNVPKRSPPPENNDILHRLETNRKKYSDLMQKLEDADSRLMVNKERYNEVKESLVGALKNLEMESI